MSTRKPKTAQQLANGWNCCDPTLAHLAGQRSGRVRMKKELREKLNELLSRNYDSDKRYGIRLVMETLKIKETK